MIELLTAPTPNGWKVSIALEELALPYTVRPISFQASEQKEEWFLTLNPNGRIPVIVDHGNGDFPVFESGAILVYLAEKTGQLLPTDVNGRSRVMQWLMFQMGGIGPMMGQANVFYRYAPEKIEYAIQRYQRECRRLFEVLERGLQDREFLAGDYSIADIANWSWVQGYTWAGLSVDDLPNLQRWLGAIGDRAAVQRGKQIPRPVDTPTAADDRVKVARSLLV